MSFTKVLSAILVVMSLNVCAFAGNEGGGGDQLIVEFIQIANNFLTDPSIDESDKEVIRTTLSTTKIVTTLQLKNPVTGEVIPKQATLVAWGSPNLIQLKLSSGIKGEESWDLQKKKNKALAHLVFHELYRASGKLNERGESPDDVFQISIGKYRLDQYVVQTSQECKDADRALLEAYVLRTTLEMHGRDAEIKIGSQQSVTNTYGHLECIYTIVYSVTQDHKTYLGSALFNAGFSRPRPESQIEVKSF